MNNRNNFSSPQILIFSLIYNFVIRINSLNRSIMKLILHPSKLDKTLLSLATNFSMIALRNLCGLELKVLKLW